MVVGRPGVLKTPALLEALVPLRHLEYEARELYEEALNVYEAEGLLAEAKRKEAQKAKKRGAKKTSKAKGRLGRRVRSR